MTEQRKKTGLVSRFRSTLKVRDRSEKALAERGEEIAAELEKSKTIMSIRKHEGWPFLQERIVRRITAAQKDILLWAGSPVVNREKLRSKAAERKALLQLLGILETENRTIEGLEQELTKVMRTIEAAAAVPLGVSSEELATTVGGPSSLERE